MMEAARASETSVDIDLSTRHYILEASELHWCIGIDENYKRHQSEYSASMPRIECGTSRI
jgi:hypothetical protein